MELLWIGIGIGMLVAAGLAFTFLRKPASPADAPLRHSADPHAAGSVHPQPQPQLLPADTPPAAPAAPMPAELAAFHPIHAGALAPERRAAINAVFRHVPRPPRLLDQLLSPDFVDQASSAELADLIAGEPLIAARVLATINSPLYGLRSPVASVDQAVTLLGLTSVRAICLQYLMIASFKADGPERQRILDTTWHASALASELTHQLAQRLGLPEPGALVSAVVLSFLGRLASAAAMPRGLLAALPEDDLLKRLQFEQHKLGLGSGEIGRLLMADWGLPADVADEAAAIDSVLTTPCARLDPVHAGRLALCYVCARLGERLARGELRSLRDFDLQRDCGAECFHVRSYLALPTLGALPAHLRAPALVEAIDRMLQTLHVAPHAA